MNKQNTKATAAAMAKDSKEIIETKLEETKEKVSDNISDVAEKLHEKSDETQGILSEKVYTAEDILHRKTNEAGDFTQQTILKANRLGHRAADALNNSSDYIRNFDAAKAKDSVKRSFREKPEISIAIAGTFGLLIGLIIGSRRSK
jgi:ElaB/YqjD/DUF883 family membrane-anchored ribosome-binding protein